MFSDIVEVFKERAKMNKYSLNDVTFFILREMTPNEKDFVKVVPVVINKNSTKAKDLRTNKIHIIKKFNDPKSCCNDSKTFNRLFLDVMQDYNEEIHKKILIEQLIYDYESLYYQFRGAPYTTYWCIEGDSALRKNYLVKFFEAHPIDYKKSLIATQKEIVKICNSIEKEQKRIWKEEYDYAKKESKSISNKRF